VNDLKIGSNTKQTARLTRSNSEVVMKSANNRLWICLLATAVIGLTVATAPLHAQTVPSARRNPIRVSRGDSTLPAGTYVVTRQGDAIASRMETGIPR
jgi:hypothetical protein